MEPDAVIALVKEAGLRGRGGAGFPTGMKWGFIPQGNEGQGAKPHYLVVNADESEPGTCKDTPFLMANPHALVEGVAIASYAIRSSFAVIYVRGEIVHVIRRLQQRSRRPTPQGTSARTSAARASTSTSSCTPAPVPTSAARRRRCSTRSRATAASRACARRSRRRTGSTPAPPS
jgi:Na+-translocating ferredoxin:NAD+ oxidoreductase RnfC subunit